MCGAQMLVVQYYACIYVHGINEQKAFLWYVFTQITLLCLACGLTCWMAAVNRDPSLHDALPIFQESAARNVLLHEAKEMRPYPARHVLIIARHASQHTTTSSPSCNVKAEAAKFICDPSLHPTNL